MRPSLVHMLTGVKTCPMSPHKIFVHHFRLTALVITPDNLPRFETEVVHFSRAPDHIMVSLVSPCTQDLEDKESLFYFYTQRKQ